ncbi:MAG TPA: hypothetical protein VGJ30_18595 [Candidatus Angelobacter sp.]
MQSVLPQAQSDLLDNKDVERVGAQRQAVYHRARPTRVPSALHQEQIALVKREGVERLERSDKNQ